MRKLLFVAAVLGTFLFQAKGQVTGDWQTRNSGNWSASPTNDVWQYFVSTLSPQWRDTTISPVNPIDKKITILSLHTINATNAISSSTGGELVINPTGTLTMGNFAINGGSATTKFPILTINGTLSTNTYVNSNNFSIGASGLFQTAYASASGTNNGWWNAANFPATFSLHSSSTVDYNKSSTQYLAGKTISFGNLIFSNGGTKYSNSNFTVNGTLTISGSTFQLRSSHSNYNKGLGIVNNGIYDFAGTTKIYFDQGNQSISGSGSFSPTALSNLLIGQTASTNLSLSNTNLFNIDKILIYSGSTFTMEEETKITCNSDLGVTNNNSFIIKGGDASHFPGSLIILGTYNDLTSGTSQFEHFVSGNKWHIISPPVFDQDIQTIFTDNSIPTTSVSPFLNKGMAPYDETSGQWGSYFTINSTGTLSSGQGYLLRTTSNGPLVFKGNLVAYVQVDVPITLTSNGWNCIGNPYTSAIGVSDAATTLENFLTFNSIDNFNLDPSYAALYIWNETGDYTGSTDYYNIICNSGFNLPPSSGYPTLNDPYLQPGQGFIVKAASGGNASFTPGMQIHQDVSVNFYKKFTSTSWPGIRLIIKSIDKSSSTDIAFHNNMTRGLDITYDVGKFGSDPKISIYTKLLVDNGVDFAIQCLPDTATQEMVIPVGLKLPDGGTISFNAEIVTLPSGYEAIFEDRQLGVFTDLAIQDSKYTTVLDAGTSGYGRFFLHVVASTTDIKSIEKNNIAIYAYDKNIYIQGISQPESKALIYDLSGRLLKVYDLQVLSLNTINSNELNEGIYIVKISGSGFQRNERVFIK